jgi:diguanylate cyclase (GGDEF)-like protein
MVAELRTAQREGLVLQEASDMLHSTDDLREAFEVIRLAAERLFAGWSGWIASVQGNQLEVGAHWGEDHHLPRHAFETRDCWALRRGKAHMYIDASESVCCAHLHHIPADDRWPYLCMPMAAHGETVGSLHLYTNEQITESELQSVQARASRFAETLKLALSNLKLRASLQEQAMRDALTGLYNRRFLDESLGSELHRARRTSTVMAVAMIDVDHFKQFNDSWGHEAGDLVLQVLGRLLQKQVRNYDLACRYGGEELAVLMPGCSALEALPRLDQIRAQVAALRVDFKGRTLPPVTVSIGLTDAMQDSAEAVLRRADMALYQAKRRGRNRVVLADKRDGDAAAATPDDADGAQTRDGARTVTAVAPVDAATLASHAEVATTALAD